VKAGGESKGHETVFASSLLQDPAVCSKNSLSYSDSVTAKVLPFKDTQVSPPRTE